MDSNRRSVRQLRSGLYALRHLAGELGAGRVGWTAGIRVGASTRATL